MRRKSKFIERLTEEQKSSLQKGYSHGKSPLFRRKCHCLLQSNTGKTSDELAIFFQVNKRSVLNWFTLWEKAGIEGLKLKEGRGRKLKLKASNSEHVKVVKALIKNENQNLTQVRIQVAGQLKIELSKKHSNIFFAQKLNLDAAVAFIT